MSEKNKGIIKDIMSYVLIILAVISIRIFIFDPVRVDGESMNTTLQDGEILIVDKLKYRRSEIERYDVVVIKLEGKRIIKRVIGLPNEVIEIKNNRVYADGVELDNSFASSESEDFKMSDIGLVKVPGNSYLVMGDNRFISNDSRNKLVGTIRKEKIEGKAKFIIWPLNKIGKVK